MTVTLPRQAWLSQAATTQVMDALTLAGGEDCARFVGGCVRDALSRRPVNDIDIATTLTPDEVITAVRGAGLRAIPTGVEHGTVTVVAEHTPFEITTLRRDVETDGRRAVVAFTRDWAEDAARRDFRINALYADREGVIYDPSGGGLADVAAGAIVFVGDAETRIREDALRILRYFRFLAWYGRGEPDGGSLRACQALAPLVEGLSAERVAKELLTLLAAEDPRAAVRLMAATGVLAHVVPETAGLARFESLVGIETEQLFTEDALLRLAALLPDDPAVGAALADRLRLSNVQKARLAGALGTDPPLVSWMSPRQVRQAVWRIGAQAFCDRATLAWAGASRPGAAIQWRALLPLASGWQRPALPLTGEEVVAAGVPRGPMVGAVMREVEAWWVDSDFTRDKLSVVERLKSVVQGMVH
jgi:poly(A) polymerase